MDVIWIAEEIVQINSRRADTYPF